jgi:hypothetical protein
VVSFTPRLLYAQGKTPRYTPDRRSDGPQRRSGRCGEEKKLAVLEIELQPYSP